MWICCVWRARSPSPSLGRHRRRRRALVGQQPRHCWTSPLLSPRGILVPWPWRRALVWDRQGKISAHLKPEAVKLHASQLWVWGQLEQHLPPSSAPFYGAYVRSPVLWGWSTPGHLAVFKGTFFGNTLFLSKMGWLSSIMYWIQWE